MKAEYLIQASNEQPESISVTGCMSLCMNSPKYFPFKMSDKFFDDTLVRLFDFDKISTNDKTIFPVVLFKMPNLKAALYVGHVGKL